MRAESAHAALLVVIVAGLALAGFATYETFVPAAAGICSINQFVSCSAVDKSGHTSTLGVPDWAVGLGGFLVLLGLDVPLYRTWRRDLLKAVVVVSGLGLVASAYFAYVELAVIGALCPVCFSTYVADAAAFALSFWLLRSSSSASDADDEGSTAQRNPSP
jgi:uncharacterized membrane protein